jgi:hypothetical protein
MNTTHRVIFSLVVALASTAAQNAGGGLGTGEIAFQPCITAADADMTAGKTAQGYYFDHRSSNGIVYSQDCNPAYTVDINVTGSYNAPGIGNAIIIGGGFDQWSQLTQANCKDASESLLIYKRTGALFGSWSAWKLVNSQSKQGTWVPFVDMGIAPYCALTVPIRVVAPAQPFLIDQYRVMVRPALSGTYVPARVDWEWSY